MDEEFQKVYSEAVDMADSVGTEPSMPRLCGRQQHRANADMGGDIEGYYRVNVAIPFINHIKMQMELKFDSKLFVVI